MTFLLVSTPFLLGALIVFAVGGWFARRAGRQRPYLVGSGLTLAVLLVLTAVFDNLMIAAGLFDYGGDHISGVRLGLMPVEDFLYPVVAVLLLAGLREVLGDASPGEADARG